MEWKAIKEQMEILDANDEETSPVTNSLRLSYDRLKPRHKAAFLDVVNIFYGWCWEVVERILGVKVLKDLKNSSLISEADDRIKCNQSALRVGCYDFSISPKVVTVHDLILKFGGSLSVLDKVVIEDFAYIKGFFLNHHSLEASKLRNLVCYVDAEAESELLQFLERATNLQTLYLRASNAHRKENRLNANSTHLDSTPFRDGSPYLRYLRLDGWKSSRLIMEMMVSREIRQIYLQDCDDVLELPDTPLQQLERLMIHRCRNFLGFSKSCVKQWLSLKDLEVSCGSIARVPDELGDLGNLRSVNFRYCRSLKKFPSLCNSNGPSNLVIQGCGRSETVGTISCPLQRLQLRIPIANLNIEEAACVLLQKVHLGDCSLVEVLPSSIRNASSLEELSLSSCNNLKQIHEVSGKLKRMEVEGCRVLERLELPRQVGRLTSLKVYKCNQLKGLPSGIGDAFSLLSLSVSGCTSLVELPDELGQLTSLTKLDVSGCTKLKLLPPSLCNCTALEDLDARNCDDLEIDIHFLGSLKELKVDNKLLAVRSLSSLSQLQVLEVESRDAVEVLQFEELGTLTSLRDLRVTNCKSLRTLPASIGDLISLKKLSIDGCDELESLPAGVCKASFLEALELINCQRLQRLHEELGRLSCLKRLQLRFCVRVKKLPDSICNIQSLETLEIWCGLVELPVGLGSLTSLSRLAVLECPKLAELPNSICNATSLESLDLRGCRGLKELPQDLGSMLKRLKYLSLGRCRALEELPTSVRERPDLRIDRW